MNYFKLSLGVAAASLFAAAPVGAEVDLSASAELRQVIGHNSYSSADLDGWLEAAVSGAARFDTQRVQGNANIRYGRRFEEFGEVIRRDRVNGDALVLSELAEDTLFFTVGGHASQYARDFRGFNSIDGDNDNANQAQVLSGFAEPRFVQRLGNDLRFDANYRFGVTSVDGVGNTLFNNDLDIGVDGNGALGSRLDDSVTHSAGVSLGTVPGRNRFNVTAYGNWVREDIDQLNQEYRAYMGGLQLDYQLDRKWALLGSVGYEDILNTQDSILFDPETNLPVLDAEGNFVIDPANPRRTAFERSGITYDGGFRWTPSRRTSLTVRGGYRYGGTNFSGDLRYESRGGIVVRGVYREGITSFGRLLTQSIGGQLVGVDRIGFFEGTIPECVLGIDPLTGTCAFDFTQSVFPATFRSRNGSLTVSKREDRIGYYGALFYDRRAYVDLQQLQAPGQPPLTGTGLDGEDVSYGLRAGVDFDLPDRQRAGVTAVAARNSYALSYDRTDTTLSAAVDYSIGLGRSLYGTARVSGSVRAAGSGVRDSNSYLASVGLRYQF